MQNPLPSWEDLRQAPRLSLATLLVANVLPIVGVLAWGWDLGLILLLYWLESAVILVFSLIKVAATAGRAAFGLVPFFLVHAGMFMGVHLLFLVGVFIERPAGGWLTWSDDIDILVGLGVLAASHLVSFLTNFVVRRERPSKGGDVMVGFYGRIVVMHLTIIFGAILVSVFGARIFALLLLVALKTLADAAAHVRERAKAAGRNNPPRDVVSPS